MDVAKSLLAVAVIFALSACSNSKSVNSVFPENGAMDSAACTGEAIENKFIVQWEDGRFSVETDTDAEAFKRNFIEPRLQDIKFVEYDRKLTLDRTSERVQESSGGDNWGQNLIQAQALWQSGIKGQNVLVAIVDAYVDISHPQLQSRIAINTAEIPDNGIDDDGNGVVDDVYGAAFVSNPGNSAVRSSHGSHVAGIVVADSRFGPIEGVAPEAQIIPSQFIADSGGGELGDAILALQYAAQRGARIINASWGGAPCVGSLRDAFAALEKQGILLVVAAGNSGRNIDIFPEFPAAFNVSTQITVAAGSRSDFMTSWSNNGFNLVQLAAPGESILSTIPNGRVAYMDGTSMAAPFVSGAAALLWSAEPRATAQQIRQSLLQSVDVPPNHEYRVSTRGRLNVSKALARLRELVP